MHGRVDLTHACMYVCSYVCMYLHVWCMYECMYVCMYVCMYEDLGSGAPVVALDVRGAYQKCQ